MPAHLPVRYTNAQRQGPSSSTIPPTSDIATRRPGKSFFWTPYSLSLRCCVAPGTTGLRDPGKSRIPPTMHQPVVVARRCRNSKACTSKKSNGATRTMTEVPCEPSPSFAASSRSPQSTEERVGYMPLNRTRTRPVARYAAHPIAHPGSLPRIGAAVRSSAHQAIHHRHSQIASP